MMTTKPIGLYVHIPFCRRKCNYCDFCSLPIGDSNISDDYINALCREIEGYKWKKISLDTIFFGGGTPSILTPSQMERIVLSIGNSFNIIPSAEFTVEANPKTLSEEKLVKLKDIGVNRLSIGLQSIHENELKILGRIHNYNDFLENYNKARELGFENINIDLMYGIPEQSIDSFSETLRKVIALSPEHISLYGLILEEGTPFFKSRDTLKLPSEDCECDMYYLASKILGDCAYSHYEISNYAKGGCFCRHNLKYWRCEEYIGVGPSAYSYFEGCRYGNTRDLDEYLSGTCAKYEGKENIDSVLEAYEYVMLRLRLKEGFSLEDYYKRFGVDFCNEREDIIEKFCSLGLAKKENGRFSLTDEGFYVSNSVINELI